NADAPIAYSNLGAFAIALHPDLHLASVGRVLDGIAHQVAQHLVEPVLVAPYGEGRFRGEYLELVLLAGAAELRHHALDEPQKVDPALRRFERAALDARYVQQVLDQAFHAPALILDDVDDVFRAGASGILAETSAEELGVAHDRREWRLELV